MVDFECKPRYDIQDLLRIMELLRSPDGCPWDRAQTHQSIRRNMLEEAYEAAEAIDENDPVHLKEELGDVLLQVVFHARMAQEAGWFDFDDVVNGVAQKLVFRHPYVLGLRPRRSARTFTSKEPKPTSWTFSSWLSAPVMASTMAVIAASASFLESSAFSATAAMSSVLFIVVFLLCM